MRYITHRTTNHFFWPAGVILCRPNAAFCSNKAKSGKNSVEFLFIVVFHLFLFIVVYCVPCSLFLFSNSLQSVSSGNSKTGPTLDAVL